MINENKEHPIEKIMDTAMTRLRTIIDADTIIGNPVRVEGTTVIPISKVTLGFITGGGEYSDMGGKKNSDYPFAGGSGGGVSVVPIGFLIESGDGVKLVPMDAESAYEKLLGMIPGVVKNLMDGEKKK